MSISERHIYDYDVDTTSNTAPAHVVRMVGLNKRVVEIGCGPGSITKILATQGNCKVTGLELDQDAIEIVKPYCDAIYQADLNAPNWPNLLDGHERFDVLVAADVLEHLYDPWRTLQQMTPLINSSGYLVISLPHIGHAAIMACLMNGDFEYRDWGLLDRTHIRFFCIKNIEDMFYKADLKIIEVNYVTKPPIETEFAIEWNRLTSTVQDALMSSKHSEIYQVVVKAVPISYPNEKVPLVPPKQNYQQTNIITGSMSWKTSVGKFLSVRSKANIRKILNLAGIKV